MPKCIRNLLITSKRGSLPVLCYVYFQAAVVRESGAGDVKHA